MAGITLAYAQEQLDLYLAAERAVLNNQSYSIGDRTLTRANLVDIQKGIETWDLRVKKMSRGGLSVRHGVPVTR